jgi:2-methylfumaryl-CoA hydratase
VTDSKTNPGRFFEDFRLGETIAHATPRSLGPGERALYIALTGSRFAVQSSHDFARRVGYASAPLDDLLVFHIVFGRSVPDISLNAVANLGYAEARFGAAVHDGDSLTACSTVIGLKENSSRETGTVYVRTEGLNQHGDTVLSFVRWVMVRKRDKSAPAPAAVVPPLAESTALDLPSLLPEAIDLAGYDPTLGGSEHLWEDYEPGERIDHLDGMTIEESCHMTATRLYQNTAKVHFNQHAEKDGRFGRRIVYGGHVISLARALSFNGLANGFRIAAINAGRHVNPCFAGDTVYAWSEVKAKTELPRKRAGALRLRTIATKDRPCADFPSEGPEILLDLDYTVLMPRR